MRPVAVACCGPPVYQAPLCQLKCLPPTQLLCGLQTPYAGLSEEQIVQQKVHSPGGLQPPAGCPGALASLIAACLDKQHARRPTFANITASLHSLLATFWSDDHP